jgi:hypothetical protein
MPASPQRAAPCQEHPCDGCATCRRGWCCRRDNPAYQLPALGEWDGPIYGELGVLAELDAVRVVCHCCGGAYRSLDQHLRAHDLTAAEYRAIFGLGRRDPLRGRAMREQTRAHALRLHAAGVLAPHPETLAAIPREQRAQVSSRPRALAVRLRQKRRPEPEALVNQRASWATLTPEQARARNAATHATLAARRADPAWEAAWRQRLREAHLASPEQAVPRPCEHCGTPFYRQPHRQRRYCSPACARAARRATPEGRAAIAAQLRAGHQREEHTCRHCGQGFTAETRRQVYCSGTCRAAARRRRGVERARG